MIPGICSDYRSPVTDLSAPEGGGPQKTYLAELVEALESAAIIKLEEKSSHFYTAAKIAVVISIAMASVAAVATALTAAPIYLFIAVPAGLIWVGIGAIFHLALENISEGIQEQATFRKQVNVERAALDALSIPELQRILQQNGVDWLQIPEMGEHPENLAALKPLIAAHRVCQMIDQEHLQKGQAKLQEARSLQSEPEEEMSFFSRLMKQTKIESLQIESLKEEWYALQKRVCQAFYNAILLNPHYVGDSSTIGKFSPIDIENRLLESPDHTLNAAPLWTFLLSRNPTTTPLAQNTAAPDRTLSAISSFLSNNTPITYEEAKTHSLAQLTQRMVSGMVRPSQETQAPLASQ